MDQFPESIDHLDDLSIDEVITRSATAWAESRKIKNETVGEDRAQQELAFRSAIISEKEERIGKNGKYIWLTVNPRREVLLNTLLSTTHRAYKKKWIEHFAYVFETTSGGHNHTHGLIKSRYEAARARKELANTFKDICDISNNHCFKFVILTAEQAKEKLEYMLGRKKPSKLSDVELTVAWRAAHDIQPIYTTGGGLISC